ncbi:hypothetical protein LIER_41216 [Lithospermum erythrorhizon]|uniref:Uncharacterized protein n=1 Tax=Lithospermum erythrorhizon TaxID=34254 RepID=A0AAV3R5S2_LITER
MNCRILINKHTKTLLPRIEFFKSKGVSSIDLVNIILYCPNLLDRSLKGFISPSFEFFRGLLGSDQSVISILKFNARLLSCLECRVKPNIERKYEILILAVAASSSLSWILGGGKWQGGENLRLNHLNTRSDTCVIRTHTKATLLESIEEVRKMGMDPNSCSYNLALAFLTIMSKSKWNEKMEVYKRWGCSKDEVLATFRIQPWIMTLSEEKINAVMSFCVEEMGWKPSEVVRTYYLLTLSLNKRIRPRWSVYQELVSKRLVKEAELFLEKYVKCYEDEAHLLSKLYLEKMEASK